MRSLRAPTLADADALLALMRACDVATIGQPDTTMNDVLDELRDPDLDLSKDAWVATDDNGDVAGCAFVFAHDGSDIIELDIYVHPAAADLGPRLWAAAEMRASEIGRAFGLSQLRLDIGIQRADEPQRTVARDRGFEPATAFYRMRIDFDGQIEPPTLPADFSIETVGADDRLRKAAHTVDRTSFAKHFGFVDRSYESWEAQLTSSTSTGLDSIRLLSVAGTPVGVLIESSQFVEDENCGYVDTLGVLKEYRGRGIGRMLLLDAFARDAAAGRAGTILHVDANNLTPALGLYESVGMRTVLVSDAWRRTDSL